MNHIYNQTPPIGSTKPDAMVIQTHKTNEPDYAGPRQAYPPSQLPTESSTINHVTGTPQTNQRNHKQLPPRSHQANGTPRVGVASKSQARVALTTNYTEQSSATLQSQQQRNNSVSMTL